MLVRTLSQALGLVFKRIQFTPDLMPSDITGTDIIEEDTTTGHRTWTFVAGPIFTNILLADEINRTTPKTQSALLEAMNDGQVTIDVQPGSSSTSPPTSTSPSPTPSPSPSPSSSPSSSLTL